LTSFALSDPLYHRQAADHEWREFQQTLGQRHERTLLVRRRWNARGVERTPISTFNPDGSIHGTVVWQEVVEGALNVNSAVGRRWPSNLDADPRVTVVVLARDNPYEYVEVRGTATRTADGADEQIDRLAKKYIGQDRYPFRGDGEQRVHYVVTADRVRHRKQG
jgi:PPOX class probable F420-dependent enzyme